MDEERYKLEKELIAVDKKLEKEKEKRMLILFLIYSVICGLFLLNDNDGIIDLILSSIIFGGITCFFTTIIFGTVTYRFTSITYLENRKRRLEEKLNYNDDEY